MNIYDVSAHQTMCFSTLCRRLAFNILTNIENHFQPKQQQQQMPLILYNKLSTAGFSVPTRLLFKSLVHTKLYIISVKTTRVYALHGHYALYIIMCSAIVVC